MQISDGIITQGFIIYRFRVFFFSLFLRCYHKPSGSSPEMRGGGAPL